MTPREGRESGLSIAFFVYSNELESRTLAPRYDSKKAHRDWQMRFMYVLCPGVWHASCDGSWAKEAETDATKIQLRYNFLIERCAGSHGRQKRLQLG